jgi:pimeloyl-ACP methyl ester carboxylesterase
MQQLQSQGWHVLVLHFAGAWGSAGQYDMTRHPQDAHAALDFALGDQAPYQVKRDKVAIIGFSLGSRAAILTAAEDQRVGAVVILAGFCDFADTLLSQDFFEESAPFLNGATAEILIQQWTSLGEGSQPYEALPQIAPRPMLVVHGTADDVVPFFHADCLIHYGRETAHLAKIEGANHTFDDQRGELIKTVTDFLGNWARQAEVPAP